MKLYYSAGSCSLSPHIVAREAGLPLELEEVDLGTGLTKKSGADFTALNPKGYVPALQLDDGSFLTEGVAIVQYLADKAPKSGLAPAAGTMERYRLLEWLNFIATEVHKGWSPLWNPASTEEQKTATKAALAEKFTFLETALAGKTFLTGSTFTAADAYLFTVLSWSKYSGVTLPRALQDYVGRVAERPAVHATLEAEGLLES